MVLLGIYPYHMLSIIVGILEIQDKLESVRWGHYDSSLRKLENECKMMLQFSVHSFG